MQIVNDMSPNFFLQHSLQNCVRDGSGEAIRRAACQLRSAL